MKLLEHNPTNRLEGLSLLKKSVVTDRPDMTLDVCRGCKTKTQQQQSINHESDTWGGCLVPWLVVMLLKLNCRRCCIKKRHVVV